MRFRISIRSKRRKIRKPKRKQISSRLLKKCRGLISRRHISQPNPGMRAAFVLFVILLILSHSACKRPMTAMTEVHKGRQALIAGKARTALDHFQRATELDPNFLFFSTLPQSAFTYTGRALYQLGKFSEARQAFEQ